MVLWMYVTAGAVQARWAALANMETLTINGLEKQFPTGLPVTLAELLEQLGIQAATVVAEVDGQIVESKYFAETRLREGQSIELLRFVGGG